jgi:hypothetical protein
MSPGVDEARLMTSGFQELQRHLMQRKTLATKTGIDRDKSIQVESIPLQIMERVHSNSKEWMADYNEIADKEMISWNGRHHHCGHPMATIFTDACEWQKGVYVHANENHPEIQRQIPMDWQGADQHITHSETDASTDGVIETVLERDLHDGCLALCVDASATMPYQQNRGGRLQALSDKIRAQTRLLKQRRLTTMVYHIQGLKNPADKPSRDLVGAAEYQLATPIFDSMKEAWGPFSVDAFAAKWNKQMTPYYTFQRSDKMAAGFDFMAQPMDRIQEHLSSGTIWMFPPPHQNLIMEILRRIQVQRLEVVIILPFWQTAFLGQAWPMLTDSPSLIAVTSSSLVPPTGYQRWNKSKYTSVDHMLTSKTWRNLIGLRLSGADKSRGVWLQNWRKQLDSFTKHEREKHEADTFKAHGHFFSQSSDDVTAAVKLLSQMLSFAM